METPKFTRKIEDFVCEHCGQEVKGNGYTNHCPNCLWSKHVDVNPGDRAADCGGLMRPVSFEVQGQDYYLVHRCQECGHEKKNKLSQDDDLDKVIGLINEFNKEVLKG